MEQTLNTIAIGRRLVVLREAFSLKKGDFADALNIDRTNYGRFEKGTRMLPLDVAYKISKKYNVSMDWLYAGRTDHLSLEVARRLSISL
jgi:transcriptional regulator with XRE-family HTH domain